MGAFNPGFNPLTPAAMAGVPPGAPVGYVDTAYWLPYDVNLAGGAARRGDKIQVPADADFIVRAACYALSPASVSSTFRFRLYDSQDYALSSGMIAEGNLSPFSVSPTPIFPDLVIPAAGEIGIDIENTDPAPANTLIMQLVFVGIKRYRAARQ